ncbi:hypothetical protein [Flavimaricola marinus]|uniref:Uncharacterized protein n=1 Tax=Flavimaricola marinus TaxID=1819565 RepID=A0A238LD29_9RHOB|nr:hypothetical protein [Flavimaricola marinus]SMY07521.1 hypothetical protein LOM8899_01657 [Flavimaricola marinus]
MVTYVNRKCGNCGTSLTGGYTQSYNAIGEPYIQCRKCQSYNDHSDACTEWELMSGVRKTFFVLHMSLNAVMLSAALTFVMFLPLMDYIRETWQLVPLGALALLICGGYRILQFQRLTSRSNARMAKPSYREKLRRLGYLDSPKGAAMAPEGDFRGFPTQQSKRQAAR